MKLSVYKKFIKKKVRNAAFEYLHAKKSSQSKIEDISYTNLSVQKYLNSDLFTNDEVYLLSKLRSRNIQMKENFPGMHADLLCSFGCLTDESQQHLLQCKPILEKSTSNLQ